MTVSELPVCPKCGSPMALRTAKKGRNAGGQFWGCTTFPRCRGIRDFGDKREPVQPPRKAGALPFDLLPVEWMEGVRRADFIREYVSVGATPGILQGRLGKTERRAIEVAGVVWGWFFWMGGRSFRPESLPGNLIKDPLILPCRVTYTRSGR